MKELYKKIINMLFKKKFGKDTIWLLLSQIALIFSAFGTNVLIGAKMSAADLGIFNLSLSYYSVFSVVFSFGLNITTIQKISANVEGIIKERKIFTSNVFVTLVFSTTLTLLLILILKSFPNLFGKGIDFNNNLITCLIALPFFNLNKVFMSFYSGKRNQKLFSIFRFFRWILIFSIVLIFIVLKFDISIILYVFLITEFLLFIANLFLKHDFYYKLYSSIIKENLIFGVKSYVTDIVTELNDKLDIIIVGFFITNTELGVYSFVIFFAKSLYMFPGIMQQNFSPIISTLWVKNEMENIKGHIKNVRKINFLVILLQLIVILIAYNLIILFIKKDFLDTERFLYISCVGVFIYASVYWAGSILTMTEKLNINVLRTVLVFIISVTNTYILCKYYGLIGATISVSLNGLISFLLLKIFIKKTLNIKI